MPTADDDNEKFLLFVNNRLFLKIARQYNNDNIIFVSNKLEKTLTSTAK